MVSFTSMRLAVVRAAAVSLALYSLSCGNSSGRSALEITVTIAPGARSACVIVEAGGQRTEPLPLLGKTELKVGVLKTERMPASIPVIALGYSDEACQARVVPTEQSESRDVTFEPDAVVRVALTVAPVTGPTDTDGDGWAVPGDCDDGDPAVHPDAPELCANQADEDCDQLVDCADQPCDGQACATGAVCGAGACREQACADGVDNDGSEGTDCADPDCAGRPCLNGGTCNAGACQGAMTEVGLCADGQDNEPDGLTDCADPDCAAQACSDGTLCTSGETCQATQCSGGAPVTCPAAGPVCTVASTGVCQPSDGGCSYAAMPADAGCDDGNPCTLSDRCDGDGGCWGVNAICASPPSACLQPTGICNPSDAGCDYAPRPGFTGACNDLNNCTAADACDGDGGCAGAPINCAPAACQLFSGACTDGGACIFTPTPGLPCDGGTCNAQATCVPQAVWPYTPSNFTPGQVPIPSNTVVVNCSTAAIRTQLAAPVVVFEGWCAGSVQPSFALGTSTATAPVILSMLGLDVTNPGVLRIYGQRPVIFAVQGDVLVDGEIRAGALGPVHGAGGNADCPGNARPSTGGCAAFSCGGGGGGGFATAGRDGGVGEQAGAVAGAFGNAWGSPELVPLVGGCAGASGAAVDAGSRAPGGGAGGALQISATGSITVNDRVSSVGGGGRGALADTGGGGGGAGSGGALLFEAATFTLANGAWLSCNGGGGGEGADNNDPAEAGADGDDNSTTAANGGDSSANNGGNGGDGATSSAQATNGANGASTTEHGGGGGGGAGLGRLRLNVAGSCTRPGDITAAATFRTPDGGTCL